jgi:polysaccharide deacetylase family protein (PEP-CTERM system associated)
MTIDVEEWFNILDVPGEIPFEKWGEQENRLVPNMEKLLELLRRKNVKATCFWLGYFAEKYPDLVRLCASEGHEIASHGYAHILAFKSGRKTFREDITKAKDILENIIQKPVLGFRAAGFSTTDDSTWVFDEIRQAGYLYDSSVFPASRNNGGMTSAPLGIYTIKTAAGDLIEIPQSMVTILGHRINMFGGGYLRLFPYPMIKWGINKLKKKDLPLVVYVHPREIDPTHPRLIMPLNRKFKSYVNLKTTYLKLLKLCRDNSFYPISSSIHN